MTIVLTPAAAAAVARWTDPDRRPLFKGQLIDASGCACAQGDVMLHNGFTADDLRRMDQNRADKLVAEMLGISIAHAILLRNVNDQQSGCPQDVLVAPEKVLGDQAHIVLAFWRHLNRMTVSDWVAAQVAAQDAAQAAAWDAAGVAAWDAAGVAAWDAARVAAWDAARVAAWDAARAAAGVVAGAVAGVAARAAAGVAARAAAGVAARASNEIQGARVMQERGQPFFFLPMFDFANPEEVLKKAAQ